VVVVAGDSYQGTAISNLSQGAVVNKFFDDIGVQYSAIGNHDFDYGQDVFKKWQKNKFKFLVSNIISTNGFDKYFQPYGNATIASGKTVYFIGLSTLETPVTTAIKNLKGLEFTNPITAANKWVAFILSNKEHHLKKADAIVLLTHIGSYQNKVDKKVYYDIKNDTLGDTEINAVTKNIHGINAIISSHSHQYVSGYLNGVAVVQGQSHGKSLSVLHFHCGGGICKATPEVINLDKATQNLPDDKNVEKMIAKYTEKNKQILDKVISYSSQDLTNRAVKNSYNIKLTYMIADVIRKYAKTDVGMQNIGGIRASLDAGDITYDDIYNLMPFDNTVIVTTFTGAQLLKVIKHSYAFHKYPVSIMAGVKVDFDKRGQMKKVLIDNKPLDIDKEYSLATLDFLYYGGDSYDFVNAKNYKNTNVAVRYVVLDYWQKNGLKAPKGWQNVTVDK